VGPRAVLDRQKISSPPGFDPGTVGTESYNKIQVKFTVHKVVTGEVFFSEYFGFPLRP